MCIQKRSGYIALLSVLIVSVIAAATVLILFVTSINATLNSGTVAEGAFAKVMAESCAELALQYVADNVTDPCGTYCGMTVGIAGQGMCKIIDIKDISAGSDGTRWRIRSTGSGTMNIVTRFMEVEAYRNSEGLSWAEPRGSGVLLTSWKECIDFTSTPCTVP
jgi:hypothetical protein